MFRGYAAIVERHYIAVKRARSHGVTPLARLSCRIALTVRPEPTGGP